MTSTLRISYPHITRNALDVTPSAVYDEDYQVANLITGRRSNYAQLATAATTLTVDYDLGTGNTATCNHLIIGRADLLQADVVDNIYLRGDDNAAFPSPENVVSDTDWDGDALTGPDTQDYIITFTASTALRFWRVELSKDSGTTKFPCSNIYFGTFWDALVSPADFEYKVATANESTIEMSMGNIILTRTDLPRYVFNITWEGVTDVLTTAFKDNLLKKSFDNYVYLYTTSAEILADNTLVYCRLIDESTSVTKTKIPNYNIINASFEQVIK